MPRTEVFNKDLVITQARDVFWAKGYNGTSMQDLVDATGLNRSSIYNSFGSKMELFRTCLSQYQGTNFDYIEQVFCNANSPLEGIRKFFVGAVHQIVGDKNGKGCMVVNCSTEMANQDSNVASWLGLNQDKMIQVFNSVLNKAQQKGELSASKDPELLAHYLVSFTQGLRVTGTHNKDKKVLLAMVDHVMASLN